VEDAARHDKVRLGVVVAQHQTGVRVRRPRGEAGGERAECRRPLRTTCGRSRGRLLIRATRCVAGYNHEGSDDRLPEYRRGGVGSFITWLYDAALSVGGPGLFVIAFLDSSFVSLPQINDLLVVLMVTQ